MNTIRLASIIALSVLLTAVGCKDITFINPLPQETQLRNTSAYIGSWELIKLFGKPYTNEPLHHVIIASNTEGRVSIHIPDYGKSHVPFDKISRLYVIGGKTYFGSPRIRTELDPTNGTLYVYTMDPDTLQAHVRAGFLSGRIDEHNKHTTITVTATSHELATFVSSKNAGFIHSPMAILKRSIPTSQSTIPQKAKFLQNNKPILTDEK